MSQTRVPIQSVPYWPKKPTHARCRMHGKQKGYLACIHVLEQHVPVGYLEHPGMSHATLGTLLCNQCYETHPLDYEPLRIACATCITNRGLNQRGAVIETPMVIN